MKKMYFSGADSIGETLTNEEMKAISGGYGSGSGSGSGSGEVVMTGMCHCELYMTDGSTMTPTPFEVTGAEACTDICGALCDGDEECKDSRGTFHSF